jgi:DNA-binding NarL/FixJ family response regulator
LGGPVLVISDDDNWQGETRALFARAGFDVRGLRRGKEAIATARAERPSAVLIDLEIGDIDGYAVCAELRDAFGDAPPIIFTTAQRVDVHELGIRPKTVASHLQRTLVKMRVHSRVQAVAVAHAEGLLGPVATRQPA